MRGMTERGDQRESLLRRFRPDWRTTFCFTLLMWRHRFFFSPEKSEVDNSFLKRFGQVYTIPAGGYSVSYCCVVLLDLLPLLIILCG